MATNLNNNIELTRRYTKALFAIAKENEAVSVIEEDLLVLEQILTEYPAVAMFLNRPALFKKQQLELLLKLIEQHNISGYTKNFCSLLIAKGRIAILPGVIAEFKSQLSAFRGELVATVTSADLLSDEQLASIKANLEQSTAKKIQLATIVDKEILGGLKIQIESKIIDDSLLNKLHRLKLLSKSWIAVNIN
jgi:F-type H+-transporting ATPase subunit delta